MTSGSTIDYETLTQEAMRGLVRTVLTRVAKSGLPGDHHFFISYDTQVPGVGLSKRLRERYAREMTIVLQHRFWDLAVFDDRFEVKLTFDSIPERLVVPFAAIKVFFDPSVRYGLQFEESEIGLETGAQIEDPLSTGPGTSRPPRPAIPRKPRAARRSKADKDAATPEGLPGAGDASVPGAALRKGPQPAPLTTIGAGGAQSATGASAAAAAASDGTAKPAGNGAQIVSLDSFRKK